MQHEIDKQRGMDLLGSCLDVVAVALMLAGVYFVPWLKLLGSHPLCANNVQLQDTLMTGMGYLMALLGLRLLARRRFRHNRRASMMFADGIWMMTLGVFIYVVLMQLVMPLFGESVWSIAVFILFFFPGCILTCCGYTVAFFVAMHMACEPFMGIE